LTWCCGGDGHSVAFPAGGRAHGPRRCALRLSMVCSRCHRFIRDEWLQWHICEAAWDEAWRCEVAEQYGLRLTRWRDDRYYFFFCNACKPWAAIQRGCCVNPDGNVSTDSSDNEETPQPARPGWSMQTRHGSEASASGHNEMLIIELDAEYVQHSRRKKPLRGVFVDFYVVTAEDYTGDSASAIDCCNVFHDEDHLLHEACAVAERQKQLAFRSSCDGRHHLLQCIAAERGGDMFWNRLSDIVMSLCELCFRRPGTAQSLTRVFTCMRARHRSVSTCFVFGIVIKCLGGGVTIHLHNAPRPSDGRRRYHICEVCTPSIPPPEDRVQEWLESMLPYLLGHMRRSSSPGTVRMACKVVEYIDNDIGSGRWL